MMTINTKNNHKIMVDDCDYPLLSLIRWTVVKDRKNLYAQNTSFGRIHNLIVPVTKPMEVDHIDHNGLNNQKSNLRICTHQQNNWNQAGKGNGTSKYKGVCWDKRRCKWVVAIRINGRMTRLGSFLNEEDAAKCYDKNSIIHHGEFAFLNFKGDSK